MTDADLYRPDALLWAIKRSFVDYVRRTAGQVTVVAPACPGPAGFEFPLTAGPDDGELRFGGGVAFRAHAGVLDVLVAEPSVVFAVGSAQLLLGDIRAPRDSAQRFCVAELARWDGEAPPGLVAMTPRLTDSGAALFGAVYPAGSELDQMFIPLHLVDGKRIPHQATP